MFSCRKTWAYCQDYFFNCFATQVVINTFICQRFGNTPFSRPESESIFMDLCSILPNASSELCIQLILTSQQ
ncbi:hypothetical protein Y032_0749g2035 [Ancylostoma ceylanicum]|uniref:Uncharacterized protein n=1 Tax=Ancylostoma ceylanicum TaxID=53326 RepID=A0A016WGA3_9BILA|nr:hypothetical protein Y032_0749g2035 [Ancylostoma ceylanicum]